LKKIVQALSSIAVAFFLFAGNAQAIENEPKLFVQLGWDRGGDILAMAQYVNGPTVSIKANEGLILDLGVSIPLAVGSSWLETQIMVGMKYATSTGSNGSMSFVSFPVTVIEQLVLKYGITLGGGATYHFRPTLSGTGVLAAARLDMDNALGYLGQIGYSADITTLGLRYTRISYQPKFFTGKVKGDSYGIYAQVKF